MADMVLTVDARGDACPIPVVKTLKALGALAGPGSVETLVDNEIAVANLTRMGEGKGCSVATERLGEKEWRVTVTASTLGLNSVMPSGRRIRGSTCALLPTSMGGGTTMASSLRR